MTKKQRAISAIELLKQEYPEPECSLDYDIPYQLLIATRLAAQCTDARVNKVTPHLFSRYPSLEALAAADLSDMEETVKSCGFYHTKAKDIIGMSQMILSVYGGEVPSTMEELLTLPGIGRKTANLILGDVYGLPAIVCDTHCIRITNLLGLSTSKDPGKVEKELSTCLPPTESNDFCHRLVMHGRAVCVARRPNCAICVLSTVCKRVGLPPLSLNSN